MTERVSLNCIEREPKNKDWMVSEETYNLVLELRNQKFKFKEIGLRISRSCSRASQIYDNAVRRVQYRKREDFIEDLFISADCKYLGLIYVCIYRIVEHYNIKNISGLEKLTGNQMLQVNIVSEKVVKDIRTLIKNYKCLKKQRRSHE